MQGQMLLPTSKGCCTVYYSEDVIKEQGIFLKEQKCMQLYWLNEELHPLFTGSMVVLWENKSQGFFVEGRQKAMVDLAIYRHNLENSTMVPNYIGSHLRTRHEP